MDFTNPLKSFLKHVDILELQDKIDEFRDLEFKNMSYQDITNAVSKVINFDTPDGNRSILTPMTQTYAKGTKFYRVRRLSLDNDSFPINGMSTIADCWEPPEDIVTVSLGRLNKKGESLLYTSPINPLIAIEEMKIKDDEFFSLIEYEAIKPINVTIIGARPETKGLNKNEISKARMIQDFLKHEFVRDVGVGTEYLYQISESITKDYFDLPPDFQDAWCYPSVAKKRAFNVCFRSSKRSKLKLVGVQIATLKKTNDGYLVNVRCIATGEDKQENLIYHAVGSEVQKSIFPELRELT
jgi:uncharacterized protein YifN (PemK superfamily)